jgi:pectate lyase
MKTFQYINLVVLLAFTFLSAQDQCKPIGWATRSGRTGGEVSVTGGGDATPITVTTFADLKKYASDGSPRVLYVSGPVGSGWSGSSGDQLVIASNKTIIGLNPKTELKAVIKISGGKNIIVRNLVIHGPGSNSDQAWDNLVIQGAAKNIWIDHCEFWNGQDGNADVVKGADNVTFTWCIFGYTINAEHNLSNLIASSDTESVSATKLNIMFMFNWFKAASQRTPRCRYGDIHVVNNLFTEDLSVHASESGVANGYECNVKTEYNHFIGINEPIKISMQSGSNSVQESTGNLFENTSGNQTGTGTAFTPPYEYKSFMVTADKVKALVETNAGATLASPTSCVAPSDQPSLALTSGSAYQGITSGTAVTDIVYTWGGNATGVTATGLPAGLTGKSNGNTYTISGTPTATGTYIITTTQPSGTAVSQTGTITLIPATTLKIAGIDNCEGNGVSETKNSGYEQSAYFNLDNLVGASAKYVVSTNADIESQLIVRYANGGTSDRPMSLTINNSAASDLPFKTTADWTTWQYQLATINLVNGRNELVMTSTTSDGGPNIDWIGLDGVGISTTTCITTPINITKIFDTKKVSIKKDQLIIQTTTPQETEVVLLDINGKEVFREFLQAKASTHVINLADKKLEPGIYLVKITPEGTASQIVAVKYTPDK